MACVQPRSVPRLVLAALCAVAFAAPAAAQGAPTMVTGVDVAPAAMPTVATTPAIPLATAADSTPIQPPFTAAGVAGVHAMVAADALPRAAGRAESVSPAALAQRARRGLHHSQVLMIVGGVAVVLGLVTDGAASDLLLIGGAGVGLFGLYQYLQ